MRWSSGNSLLRQYSLDTVYCTSYATSYGKTLLPSQSSFSRLILPMLTCASGSTWKTSPASIFLPLPPHPSDKQNLVIFHLSLPVGYIDNAPYFFYTSKTVANISNYRWGGWSTLPPHHLEYLTVLSPTISDNAYAGLPYDALDASLADLCAQLSLASCICLLRYADIYVNNFLTLEQGDPK